MWKGGGKKVVVLTPAERSAVRHMEYSKSKDERMRKPENTTTTVRWMRCFTPAPALTVATMGVLGSKELSNRRLVARWTRMKAIKPQVIEITIMMMSVTVSADNWMDAARRAAFEFEIAALTQDMTSEEL